MYTGIRRYPIALLLVALATLLITGCGDGLPRRYPISGQVLLGEEPLGSGFVRFVPPNARPATGRIGPDGRFTLTTGQKPGDGAVAGQHVVTVIAYDESRPGTFTSLIPEIYNDPRRTPLRATVTGPNDNVVLRVEPISQEAPAATPIDTSGDEDPMNWE